MRIFKMGRYIKILAIDDENKRAILGECKYRIQPVDANVLFDLKEKSERISEIKEYQKIYALFSKSGFTNRINDIAKESEDIILIDMNKVCCKWA